MELRPFSPSHPLYRFWIIGNAGSVIHKKQARSLILNKKAMTEATQSTYAPKINAILIRGIIVFLLYSAQRINKDIMNLLKEIQDPKIASKKSIKPAQENMALRLPREQDRRNLLLHSSNYSESGNKYRMAFNNKTYINNPSEITLLEQNPNFYLRLHDLNEAFAFIDPNNNDFQEILNNYFPAQNQLADMGFDLDQGQLDNLAFNVKLLAQDGFIFKGDPFSSFTQRMNQNYNNFLMLTPTKLKGKQYFGYDENSLDRSKISEEKKDRRPDFFEDSIIKKDNVTRALNFGQDHMESFSRKKFLGALKEKKRSVAQITEDLKKPHTALSTGLLEVWDFAQGENDLFAKNIEVLNQKQSLLAGFQNEVPRQRGEGSQFHSTADKMTDKLLSQQNSVQSRNLIDSSLVKDFEGNGDMTFNYDAIEEQMNELTSTTQLFGMSESHMNPPTFSYEMSLNQYFNIKTDEEKKVKENKNISELAEDAQKFYRVLVEQSKFDKQVNFNYLVRNYNAEEKASALYNALVLTSVEKVSMKQKLRQNFGEITIVIN